MKRRFDFSRKKKEQALKQTRWEIALQTADTIIKILAVIIGGYWTWYTFKYQTDIVPSKELAQVTVKVDFEKLGEVANMSFYSLKFRIHNASKHPIHLPAGYYNISGSRTYFYDRTINYRYDPVIEKNSLLNTFFSKYELFDTSEYFISGKIFDDHAGIIPQGEQFYNHLVAFPTNKFDLVTIEYHLFNCKYDFGETGIKWYKNSENQINAEVYMIDDPSYKVDEIHSQISSVVYNKEYQSIKW